jgi:hypothetical protein
MARPCKCNFAGEGGKDDQLMRHKMHKGKHFGNKLLERTLSIMKQLFLIATVGSFFVFVPLHERLGSQSFESYASSPRVNGITDGLKEPFGNPEDNHVLADGNSTGSLGPGGNSLIRK